MTDSRVCLALTLRAPMAQNPPKDQNAKPAEADRTVRLPRKGLGLEKDEPTQALQAGVPAAESTLRLKRDEMSFEEPTVALHAGVPEADATLRLKREELALDEPTQALERPKLRTAMEVIDEATQAGAPQAKPSVMLPGSTDIPSWEETTQLFTPPPSGHGDATVQIPRPPESAHVPVDPSDSMDETFPNMGLPVLPEPLMPAAGSVLVSEIAQTEEETLVLPDMHELDELPNAMKATVILKLEPPAGPAPLASTQAMPVMEKPEDRHESGPLEATVVLQVEPKPEPMEKTMVMPVMATPSPATAIVPIPIEESSAYLTRQGQAPWPAAGGSAEPSPASTQLMSESVLSKAMEATDGNRDSALAPIPPEVSSIEADSPLAKATSLPDMNEGDRPVASLPLLPPDERSRVLPLASSRRWDPSPRAPHVMSGQSPATTSAPPPPIHPVSQGPDRTEKIVDTSIGMAVTPATLLMPVHAPLDPTTPIERPASAARHDSAVKPGPPQPMQKKFDPASAETKTVGSRSPVALPSVPGYPDRQVPVSNPEPKFQTHPIEMPVRTASPEYHPMAAPAKPKESASKLWIPAAISILVLVIGVIYFAFFRPSLKIASPLGNALDQTAEPSLPVPASMQGTLAQAKAGDSKAMHMLGVSFYYGLNVPQNKAEGLRWMRKASGAGNEKARSDLRQMEAEGR